MARHSFEKQQEISSHFGIGFLQMNRSCQFLLLLVFAPNEGGHESQDAQDEEGDEVMGLDADGLDFLESLPGLNQDEVHGHHAQHGGY